MSKELSINTQKLKQLYKEKLERRKLTDNIQYNLRQLEKEVWLNKNLYLQNISVPIVKSTWTEKIKYHYSNQFILLKSYKLCRITTFKSTCKIIEGIKHSKPRFIIKFEHKLGLMNSKGRVQFQKVDWVSENILRFANNKDVIRYRIVNNCTGDWA